MVMTMVKGPVLFGTVGARSHSHHGSILGVVFILLSTLDSAVSNILQTIILDELKQTDENDTITSLPLTVTSLKCLLGSIEALVVVLVMNKKVDYAVWTIFEWDVKVLSLFMRYILLRATFLLARTSNASQELPVRNHVQSYGHDTGSYGGLLFFL